jgi:hypothetical protein
VATPRDVLEESRRVRRAQFIVNLAASLIAQGDLTRSEAQALVAAARGWVLELFPGREETFEILYGRRFARLLDECTRPDPPEQGPARIIPFPFGR